MRTYTLTTLLLAPALTAATVVVPLRPSEIQSLAELVAVGTATGQTSRLEEGGATIRTYVTFRDLTVLKGTAQATLTLRLEGGQVGDDGLKIAGMPQFTAGKRYLLYVSGNGKHISPIVGFHQGCFEVSVENGREVLRNQAGQALVGIQDDRFVFAAPRSVAAHDPRTQQPAVARMDTTVKPADPHVCDHEHAARPSGAGALLQEAPARHVTGPVHAPAQPPRSTVTSSRGDSSPIVVPADRDSGARLSIQALVNAARVR